ncbi:MAG: orotidine 5'-phosphate decarboxylase, partial [Pseudomonadales bacterium]|nr:orotidine 5'-phosphate decarboxylase [Pseudomonadales bacterium]
NEKMLIVTPGIRLNTCDVDDQSRVGTPEYAIRAGASHVIVGRPIVQADNPAEVAKEINMTISRAGKLLAF